MSSMKEGEDIAMDMTTLRLEEVSIFLSFFLSFFFCFVWNCLLHLGTGYENPSTLSRALLTNSHLVYCLKGRTLDLSR